MRTLKFRNTMLLAGVLALLTGGRTSGQTCPTDATETAVGIALVALRINPDGSTGSAVGPNPIGICECIRLRMSISYVPIGPSGGKTAFFEGGTMTVRSLSGSFSNNVTPAAGVPLIGEPTDPNGQACGPGAVNFVRSEDSVDYCVNPADIDANGNITFVANFVGGILHFGDGITNQPTGTTAIQVHVDRGPSCSIEPASQSVCAGGSATFTASATGEAPPFTFTWTGPGGFSATGPSITIDDAQLADAGIYVATVTDAHGCTNTCTAELIVNPPPTCSIAPASQSVCIGASATFTASATGQNPPHTFAWTGPGGFTATGPSITINNAQLSNAGIYTAVVTDASGCTNTCTAELTVVPCNPEIEVVKEVACYLPGDTCGTYGKVATGVRNSECPAFCYRITVRNLDDDVSITTLTVNDSLLGDISAQFAAALPLVPGESVTVEFKAVTLCEDTRNVVTAEARNDQGQTDTDTDEADARVLNIDIECRVELTSSFDMDGNASDNHVTLPAGSTNAPVQVTLTLHNAGTSPLNVTSVAGLPALVDCADGVTPVDVATLIGLPLNIPAGGTVTTNLGCWLVSCPGGSFSASAHAEASSEDGTLCVYDSKGQIVSDDSPECPASVTCEAPVTCRTTGGGVLLPGTTDQSCITVGTTILPLTSPNGLTINKITHGGQLGAPFSQEDCGEVLGNPCIRGQWQHVRHYQGRGNPRDVFDMNFHSVTPKGVFDSLNCACLGCCDPATGAFITPITVGALCNPDDRKVCGPQPRPAPANAIIFSGIGRLTPEEDSTGPRADRSEWVVFRVYIEDRSEPGGHHPKGAVKPADIYCFQAWKTGIKVSKKPDFTTIAPAFRQALGLANCEFLEALKSGSLPIGSLPSPEVLGLTADVQDCGPMNTGNHQIHPSTSATCE